MLLHMPLLIEGKEGVTLLEVLIAILLISVSLGVIVSIMSQGLFSDVAVEKITVALNYAKSRVEQIKNTPYLNILDEAARTPLAGDYESQVRVNEVSPGLKEVRVFVYYKIAKTTGGELPVLLETYVADY